MRGNLAVFVVLVAAALAAPASAELDVVVGNGDVVRGTLLPATEKETFRVACPAGAKLTARIRSGPARAALVVRVLDSNGAEVASAGGRAAAIRGLLIATSGEHRIVVATKDGLTSDDYRLSVSWKSPRRAAATVAAGASTVAAFPFAADAGADVKLRLVPARRSAAAPSMVRVTGSHSFSLDFAGGTTAEFVAPAADTYTLTFENTAAVAGAVNCRAKLTLPKATKRNLSATSRDIPPGTAIVAAAVIDAAGGRLDAPALSAISGADVTIPPGAFSGPAIVVLGAVGDLTPPKPADSVVASPAVVVGPFLRAFRGAAKPTVELSYASAPVQTYGYGLRVFAGDDPSLAEELGPGTTQSAQTLVTFDAPRFTRFQAFYVRQPDVTPPFVLHGTANEEFGASVAVSGAFVYVGSPGAAGPGGETSAGAVRVFEHVATTWIERATLYEPSPVAGDRFGGTVRVVRGTDGVLRLFAPVPKRTVSAIPELGVVHVFTGSGAAWALEASVSPPVGADALGTYGQFSKNGFTVSPDGDRFVASGSQRYQSPPGGPWQYSNGVSFYECARIAGSWMILDHAYGYVPVAISGSEWFIRTTTGSPPESAIEVDLRSGTTLTREQSLTQTAQKYLAVDPFGIAIAVDGDTLFTGAMAFGVDRASEDALHTSVGHGRAYFGTRGASGWTIDTDIEEPFVPGGGMTPYDGLGEPNSLALQGDTAVAAVRFQPRARVYRRVSGSWSEALSLDPTPTMGTNYWNSTVALDGRIVVIGGVSGGEVYPITDFSGAIAIFELPQP